MIPTAFNNPERKLLLLILISHKRKQRIPKVEEFLTIRKQKDGFMFTPSQKSKILGPKSKPILLSNVVFITSIAKNGRYLILGVCNIIPGLQAGISK